MDDIRRVIAAAGRRLLVNDALARLTVTLTLVLALAVLARIAQKVLPFEVPWAIALPVGFGVAVLAALAWALIARKNELEVARHVDETAGLRESLSTAVLVDRAQDGWSRNIVASAGERARRVVVRDAVPFSAPRLWAVPGAVVLALLAVWWTPRYDVAGLFERKQAVQQQQAELEQVQLEVKQNEQKLNELLKKAGVDFEDGESADPQQAIDPNAPIKPDEVRREAIKKLTSLADQLDEKLNESEQSKALEAINDAMRRLKTPEPGPASEMGKQMAKGDYGQAKAELEKLAQQLASGEMSEADKKKAAEQLQQMADQLDKLANQRQNLEQQLQQSGMSEEQAKQLAANPDQLQQALQQNQNMSEQQKQQLQQAAQAQQKASDAMQAASQAMGQMAQGMQQQGSQQAMDGMDSMSGQLSQMEAMQAEMQGASAAMSEVQQQLAQMGNGQCEGGGQGQSFGGQNQFGKTGQWSAGDSSQFGKGSGGPGRGQGVSPEAEPTDYVVRKEKANVNTGDGPVIASMMVQGSQVRGESKVAFSGAVSSASAEAAEAIEHSRVPKRHEAAVQHYFGRLEAAAGKSEPEPTKSDKTDE